ncbi:hypothetical protein [Miltoncostaea marina]|uniref:hypothetical protein n=1 Tax=Miltoncostaea marina TaxID=2843215 RepID=UPI001C3D49D4|nr:hypothetical protein [Miltoncostaea marina]
MIVAPGPAAHAAVPAGAPIVWVQAGHAAPREPGYRLQTGAGAGPFGAETGFTTRLAGRVVARLRAAGIDARATPGRVTPLGARGAAFVSLHHDAPGGRAGVGHAIAGTGENWYRGEGLGAGRPHPYPGSAPHRPATPVTPAVERRSRDLALRVASLLRAARTPARGARAPWGGVEPRDGNPRMTRYHGFHRTRASARVLVEAGAAGADDAFLRRVDPIAAAVARAVRSHLRAMARR